MRLQDARIAGRCPAAVGFWRTAGGHRFSVLADRDGRSGGRWVVPAAGRQHRDARSPLARVRSPAHPARPGLGVLPNPSGACARPMRLTPPPAHPEPPRQWVVGHRRSKSTAVPTHCHALPDVGNFTAIVCRPIPPGGYLLLMFDGHRPTVWGVPGCPNTETSDHRLFARHQPQPGKPGSTAIRRRIKSRHRLVTPASCRLHRQPRACAETGGPPCAMPSSPKPIPPRSTVSP